MRRYVLCLLGAIVLLCALGMSLLYSSTAYAYQTGKLDEDSQKLAGEIAQLESTYKKDTMAFEKSEGIRGNRMVSYSPAGEEVRYARVGGSVYSMLSRGTL